MQDNIDKVQALRDRFDAIKDGIDRDAITKRIHEIESKTTDHDLWDDPNNAKELLQELSDKKKELDELTQIEDSLNTLEELMREPEFREEVEKELKLVTKRINELEKNLYLSGKYDRRNVIFSIHAGQGGTEAMDWVSMLYRMYTRYFDNKKWKYLVLEMTSGEEAGLKSVSVKVEGANAYGYLKGESGAHRLVRQSPFNSDNLRQTSFALVEVLPELLETDADDIQIKDEDLDWQFYRSSGAGGQNVNKVSTAVRLTHIPTGIVVTSQAERQQEKNRRIALDLLRSRLWLRKRAEERKELQSIKGTYQPASWGRQIRSYVLHPYKMVKDLRTGVESSDPDAVLDGDLDQFVDAELRLDL